MPLKVVYLFCSTNHLITYYLLLSRGLSDEFCCIKTIIAFFAISRSNIVLLFTQIFAISPCISLARCFIYADYAFVDYCIIVVREVNT